LNWSLFRLKQGRILSLSLLDYDIIILHEKKMHAAHVLVK